VQVGDSVPDQLSTSEDGLQGEGDRGRAEGGHGREGDHHHGVVGEHRKGEGLSMKRQREEGDRDGVEVWQGSEGATNNGKRLIGCEVSESKEDSFLYSSDVGDENDSSVESERDNSIPSEIPFVVIERGESWSHREELLNPDEMGYLFPVTCKSVPCNEEGKKLLKEWLFLKKTFPSSQLTVKICEHKDKVVCEISDSETVTLNLYQTQQLRREIRACFEFGVWENKFTPPHTYYTKLFEEFDKYIDPSGLCIDLAINEWMSTLSASTGCQLKHEEEDSPHRRENHVVVSRVQFNYTQLKSLDAELNEVYDFMFAAHRKHPSQRSIYNAAISHMSGGNGTSKHPLLDD
jgi:hypothetical protein